MFGGTAGELDDWLQRPEEKSSGSTASGEGGLERRLVVETAAGQ